MTNKYSKKIENSDHIAKALGQSISISTKHSIEICNLLRNKKLERAKIILENAISKKEPIPFKRFKHNVGHRKGKIAAGRYPKKACIEILKILNSAEANAQFKGLNTSNLIISHIAANKAAHQWRYGRQRRRKMKRTHIEVIVEERGEIKKQEKPKEEPKVKEQKKKEVTKEQKSETKETPKSEVKK